MIRTTEKEIQFIRLGVQSMSKSKLEFLEKLLGKSKYNNNTHEAIFFCCFCDHHKPKLYINLETDCFNCFVCGIGGRNLYKIIKEKGTIEDVKTYDEEYRAKGTKKEEVKKCKNKVFS